MYRGKISLKLIDVQTKIRPCRWEFIFKLNKHACTSIRYTRVLKTWKISQFKSGNSLISTFTMNFLFYYIFPKNVYHDFFPSSLKRKKDNEIIETTKRHRFKLYEIDLEFLDIFSHQTTVVHAWWYLQSILILGLLNCAKTSVSLHTQLQSTRWKNLWHFFVFFSSLRPIKNSK